MKRYLLVSGIVMMLLAETGCMAINLTAEGVDKTISMTMVSEKKFNVVKHFRKEVKCWFAVFNLITLAGPEVAQLVQNEMQMTKGDAVFNLTIQGQTTCVDTGIPIVLGVVGLVSAPPLGAFASQLIGSRTYTIEGDVIRYLE